MSSRRDFLKTSSLIAASGMLSSCTPASGAQKKEKAKFSYCLNTSTIRGKDPGLEAYIKIAAEAGYDGVELWVRDVEKYIFEEGNKTSDLKKFIEDHGLTVENAIGFAPWLLENTPQGKGFDLMRKEMDLMASIGCLRIAAAPAGVPADHPLDLFAAGRRYRELIEMGKETRIMPQLEFWGASPVLYHFAQVVMIAAAANHPDVHLLPDVYHLFRGGSGFEGLKMLSGNVIEIFHMNDFIGTIPREQQKDKDRVYPGDGIAPLKEILTDLSESGGTKVLSVELFNEEYWKQDPLAVARTALEKMQKLVNDIST